jgi:hypothetical protein
MRRLREKRRLTKILSWWEFRIWMMGNINKRSLIKRWFPHLVMGYKYIRKLAQKWTPVQAIHLRTQWLTIVLRVSFLTKRMASVKLVKTRVRVDMRSTNRLLGNLTVKITQMKGQGRKSKFQISLMPILSQLKMS